MGGWGLGVGVGQEGGGGVRQHRVCMRIAITQLFPDSQNIKCVQTGSSSSSSRDSPDRWSGRSAIVQVDPLGGRGQARSNSTGQGWCGVGVFGEQGSCAKMRAKGLREWRVHEN